MAPTLNSVSWWWMFLVLATWIYLLYLSLADRTSFSTTTLVWVRITIFALFTLFTLFLVNQLTVS